MLETVVEIIRIAGKNQRAALLLRRSLKPCIKSVERSEWTYAFDVHVRDANGESRHDVTLTREAYERLTAGRSAPETCMEAAFRFLLDREAKESILTCFDISMISRYFPEFQKELPAYLSRI